MNVLQGKLVNTEIVVGVVKFLIVHYRKSASCTHVSAVLHAVCGMKQTFDLTPPNPTELDDDNDEPSLPCTSQPCVWKEPRSRKESNLRVSDAVFEKHDYSKPVKRKIHQLNDYDPRPSQFKGAACGELPELLKKIKGNNLGVSLLLDSEYIESQSTLLQPSGYDLPTDGELRRTIDYFKQSLEVTQDQARQIERDTRDQRMSSMWFAIRRYRLTASMFGDVILRRPETPPDKLVLRILKPTDFTTPAIRYGIDNEKVAIEQYTQYQQANGHSELLVTESGFIINPSFPFLGASPDGAVYDPSNQDHPFGFVEVKCPYSARDKTPLEAAANPSFCCSSTSSSLTLKRHHAYYAQIQGQMAIGERSWCDFVIYTPKGLSIQRVLFDSQYWTENFPKLKSFYDNCIAPECVSPLHSVELPVRKLTT